MTTPANKQPATRKPAAKKVPAKKVATARKAAPAQPATAKRDQSGYARGEAARDRDSVLIDLLTAAGPEGVKLADIATKLGCSSGAARHCCWRNHPDRGKGGKVILVGKATFALVVEKPRRARATKKAAPTT